MNVFDVVVIGAGLSGAIAARNLARSGQKVLVLERGPWRDSLPLQALDLPDKAPMPAALRGFGVWRLLLRSLQWRRLRLRLSVDGAYELVSTPTMNLLAASGVGGASGMWGGLLTAPRDPDFWKAVHPQAEAIEAYYPQILEEMSALPLDQNWPQPQNLYSHFPDDPLMDSTVAREQPAKAVLLQGVHDQVAAGEGRLTSRFDGDSFLGSPGGAKASADFIYLVEALSCGARVQARCEVTSISRQPSGAYRIDYLAGKERTPTYLHTARIVLAAGTLNTLRLLFENSASGGLQAMPGLGQRFGANGDLLCPWWRPAVPHSSFSGLPSLGAFQMKSQANLATPAPFYVLGTLAGLQRLPLPRWLKRVLSQTYLLIGMGKDSGSIAYRDGGWEIDYQADQQPALIAARRAFAQIVKERGGKLRPFRKVLTTHQWGGAMMSASPDEGVINLHGEVHANPGIYVIDGAALPDATHNPPGLAIAAWANFVSNGIQAMR